MNLPDLKDKFTRLSERKRAFQEEHERTMEEITRMESQTADFLRAQTLFAELADQTQRIFREQVERLATAAVHSVFDRPYQVKLVSEKKRGRMETEILIVENGEEFQPRDEMGGSMMDLLSFAMRIILWSLQSPRSRNTFILDEPMKFLGTGERLQHAGQMLSEIARSLACQLIIVTHEPELAELADTAYMVTHDGIESQVSLLKAPAADQKPAKLKRRATA
jgi:DNA repair exonuclease SbcCD ATPase subunit